MFYETSIFKAVFAVFSVAVFATSSAPLLAQEKTSNATMVAPKPLPVQKDKDAKKNKPKNNKQGIKKSKKPKKSLVINQKRRKELFAFVNKHHAQIRPLLRSLEKKRPKQFNIAMRTLDREVNSLQRLKTKAPDRYQRSLEIWVVRSKTKLLAAKLATRSDDEHAALKKELRGLIDQHFKLREQQLKADIQNAKSRLRRLEKQLSGLAGRRSEEIQRRMEVLTKEAKRVKSDRNRRRNNRKGRKDGK